MTSPAPIYPLPPQGINQSDSSYRLAADEHRQSLDARDTSWTRAEIMCVGLWLLMGAATAIVWLWLALGRKA